MKIDERLSQTQKSWERSVLRLYVEDFGIDTILATNMMTLHILNGILVDEYERCQNNKNIEEWQIDKTIDIMVTVLIELKALAENLGRTELLESAYVHRLASIERELDRMKSDDPFRYELAVMRTRQEGEWTGTLDLRKISVHDEKGGYKNLRQIIDEISEEFEKQAAEQGET